LATTKKKIPSNQMIECKNGTMGPLIYKSNRNIGYTVEWEEFGEPQEMEYSELLNMRASQRRFFEQNWILIEDADVLRGLGVDRYYKNALTTENFDSVFKMSATEIREKVPQMSQGLQDAIRIRARQLIKEDKFDSRSAVRALSEVLGCDLENDV